MSMNKLFVFILLAVSIINCKEKTINLGENISFEKQQNISYGNDSQQKMDFYIPKNIDSIKGVFVVIHGGGWRAGDKSQLTFFTLSLMQRFPEYAFANINYRLASETSFVLPNQTNDIDEALSLLVKKTTEIKLNPEFILLGNSAGAHLSMLYGYNSFFDFKQRKKVKAIINIVGPVDLYDKDFVNYFDYDFIKKNMIDQKSPTPTDITNRDIPNPVFWITENAPSTLSYYGNQDTVIPASQKKILDSTLNKNNIIHETYEFTGGHNDWDKEKNSRFLINKIDEFLKQIDQK